MPTTWSTGRPSSPRWPGRAEPGADGRLVGKAAVGAYFAAALGRYPELHFDPPVHVAVGSGSVSFVYRSIKDLTAVETLVFAPGTRTVARAHCHYRAPAG